MNAQDYLNQLRRQLKGFSPREQEDMMAEIQSHIESGQDDPGMGEERVLAEMGTPEQMGKGLRGVHRPRRWIDVLLALVPFYAVSPLVQLVLSWIYGPMQVWNPSDPHLYLGGRISILVDLGLALLGWKRRSQALVVFWLTAAMGTLASLLVREAGLSAGLPAVSTGWFETTLLYALMFALIAGVIWVLWRSQFGLLLVVFAILPLARTAANYGTGQLIRTQPFNWVAEVSLASSMFTWFGFMGGVALFILASKREWRWLGLLLMALNAAYPNIESYGVFSQVWVIWSSTVAVVVLGWGLDLLRRWSNRRQMA